MISNVEIPLPVEYLKTGDHGLLVAWTPQRVNGYPSAILCLEDGTAVEARITEFKFDYRYDITKGKFVDVSGFGASVEEGDEGVNADQDAPDHGSAAVPGQLPDAD